MSAQFKSRALVVKHYRKLRDRLFEGTLDKTYDRLKAENPSMGLRRIAEKLGVAEQTLRRRLTDRGLMPPVMWADGPFPLRKRRSPK